MAFALSTKTASAGSAQLAKARAAKPAVARAVVVRAQANNAEDVSRRSALGFMAGAAALVSVTPASQAAYGDSANVFGKVTNKSGFVPFAGEGYALLLPSKWNPSPEQEFGSGTILRYVDNFDAVNSLVVIEKTSDKKSIDEYGAPEKFLESLGFLFGQQAFSGQTQSEGGFAPNRVSAASLLDVFESTDKKGKKYYRYEFLVRTADGDEGGRHQLISAAVSNGKLLILKIQAGDKRWIYGVDREVKESWNSFTVA